MDSNRRAPGTAPSVMGSNPVAADLLRSEIAEALPDAVFLIDGEARLSWANAAAATLFGIPVEEAIGYSGLDFIHPDDIQTALVSLTSVQDKGHGTLLEMRVRGADGWRLVELLGTSFGDGILLCMRDLTERRRWEVANDDAAQFRSLTQNAQSVTLLLSDDGSVRNSSGGITRLLGVDQEWLEGRSFGEVIDDRDRDEFQRVVRSMREDPAGDTRAITVDLALRATPASDPVPFAMTFTNLIDDPTVEGIVATGHDVSDRVRTEQALRASKSVLEATLESTGDGILVVDLDRRIRSWNKRFLEIWGLTTDQVEQLDDHALLALASVQLVDPTAFVAKVEDLMVDSEAESRDSFEFLDGRAMERDSLPQRIDGQVVGRVWSFRDITEHRRLEDELTHQAFHDPLTGLANSALFQDRVTHAAARLARSDGRLAVIFIDLDDFKTVNDSLGHTVGDQLLVAVSERIQGCLRPGDTAARLGGDEFAVLIEELSADDDATDVAGRILDVLREPVAVSSTHVSAAASMGIAYGGKDTDAGEMLRNADLAMYTAKADGKDRHRSFEPAMHHAAVERLDLETHLRGAADRGEFVVEYQPIFSAATCRIVSMEALIRWNHPVRGRLGPLAFIPFAEEGGLIDEIGRHVLATACEQACGWADSSQGAAPSVSVNLSPRQLASPDFPDRVEHVLASSGLSPDRLILEITESALMLDPAAATGSLERLSRLGVRLAIDDFGTGYSSLAYLHRFPVDILKIDGSFINDPLTSDTWSLTRAIVQIAHSLHMVAIAEGVEEASQMDALVDMGCDMVQGYHLARPMGAEAARAAVAAGS